MKLLLSRFAALFRSSGRPTSVAEVQPGLWTPPMKGALSNPFSGGNTHSPAGSPRAIAESSPAVPTPVSAGSASGGGWTAWLASLWRPAVGGVLSRGPRLFANSEQLDLVLGRPQVPARNRNLEIGLPARVRRSDPKVGSSKVIYESKPTANAEAARRMEESDRAYSRLRGRRLDSLRLGGD